MFKKWLKKFWFRKPRVTLANQWVDMERYIEPDGQPIGASIGSARDIPGGIVGWSRAVYEPNAHAEGAAIQGLRDAHRQRGAVLRDLDGEPLEPSHYQDYLERHTALSHDSDEFRELYRQQMRSMVQDVRNGQTSLEREAILRSLDELEESTPEEELEMNEETKQFIREEITKNGSQLIVDLLNETEARFANEIKESQKHTADILKKYEQLEKKYKGAMSRTFALEDRLRKQIDAHNDVNAIARTIYKEFQELRVEKDLPVKTINTDIPNSKNLTFISTPGYDGTWKVKKIFLNTKESTTRKIREAVKAWASLDFAALNNNIHSKLRFPKINKAVFSIDDGFLRFGDADGFVYWFAMEHDGSYVVSTAVGTINLKLDKDLPKDKINVDANNFNDSLDVTIGTSKIAPSPWLSNAPWETINTLHQG